MSLFGRGVSLGLRVLFITGVIAMLINSPASSDSYVQKYNSDPFEAPNRLIFSFNVGLDQLVLQPVAIAYRDLMPPELKTPINNLLDNLQMPLSFVHSLLQGDLDSANLAASRFFASIPTLFLGNPVPHQNPLYEDSGQTLAIWVHNPGPYIMLPVLGPSNIRDTAGTIIDFFIDPFSIVASPGIRSIRSVGSTIRFRAANIEQIKSLQKDSLDYYAAVKSLYEQSRENEIRNGYFKPDTMSPTIGLELDAAPMLKKLLNTAIK